MADQRLFAGAAVRQVRRKAGLSQAAMAAALGISPSYLNLIEHGQRALSAAVLVRLAERFGFDPTILAAPAPGGGVAGLAGALADPVFAGIGVDAREISDWLAAAPNTAAAFMRIYAERGAARAADDVNGEPPEVADVRRAIERWRNHFADLDAQAEGLADELRLAGGDTYGSVSERLRVRHQLAIRILPVDVMPDRLRWLDYHARQLQLSELLRAASRCFHAAAALGQLEARAEIDALVAASEVSSPAAASLLRRHLVHYFAAAVMMPYGRFLRACEATGYDLTLLQRRFGAGFEQVAHRLTTLQRVGARGLPFFMLRIDRAGQASKRFAGASRSPLVDGDGRCPLWGVHDAFGRAGEVIDDLVELEDGSRWFTRARAVAAPSSGASPQPGRFVVVLGVDAKYAPALAAGRARDMMRGAATPVGLGCRRCLRPACIQRSVPPAARTLRFHDNERGMNPFDFVPG